MMDINEIAKILNLARKNAAEDLDISNEILAIVDELVKKSTQNELDAESTSSLSGRLVDLALKLTSQSKEVMVSIAKLAGVK